MPSAMLCDDICERARRPLEKLNLPPDLATLIVADHQLVVRLAEKIHGAQRFVLTRTALACMEAVRTTRPSTLLSAKEFMRPPFRRVWFEFGYGDDGNSAPHSRRTSVLQNGYADRDEGPDGTPRCCVQRL